MLTGSKTDQRGIGAITRVHFHKDPSVSPVLFTNMYEYAGCLVFKAGVMLTKVKG